mmetsp:Transcript_32117/g.78042  ORF Transcript_32117/g.78042 Transcript_32117/m.78042 type:complete len:120 (+) Transcript_32117:1274-1633(+)
MAGTDYPQDFPTATPQGQPTRSPTQYRPTEPPQGQPTSSPNFLTEFPAETKPPRYEPQFDKGNDTVALYIGIPTMLVFSLLLCCAITCTGSKSSSKQVDDKNGGNQDIELVPTNSGQSA